MKFYATVRSERASKGQGGEYLDIEIFATGRDVPTHKVKVWADQKTGNVMIDLVAIRFAKERILAREVIFLGTEEACLMGSACAKNGNCNNPQYNTKGEKEKDERCTGIGHKNCAWRRGEPCTHK